MMSVSEYPAAGVDTDWAKLRQQPNSESSSSTGYFLRRGRGKAVVDEVLGEEFAGVLASDFYAACTTAPSSAAGPICCETFTT